MECTRNIRYRDIRNYIGPLLNFPEIITSIVSYEKSIGLSALEVYAKSMFGLKLNDSEDRLLDLFLLLLRLLGCQEIKHVN